MSTFLLRRIAGLLVLPIFAVGLVALAGQGQPAKDKPKPAREENEDPIPLPKKKITEVEDPVTRPRKVIVVGDEDQGPAVPSASSSGDLKELAAHARHDAVKKLFGDLSLPYDIVERRKREAAVERIEPIPQYVGKDGRDMPKQIRVRRYTDKMEKLSDPFQMEKLEIVGITPYEQWAWERVDKFLETPYAGLSQLDKLAAGEQALSAVLRWHQGAREKAVRKGDGWQAVESDLKKRLFTVVLKQMELYADGGAWDRAFALARRLAITYSSPEDQAKIAGPLARRLGEALKNAAAGDEQLREVRRRLRELEEQFPGNEGILPVSENLKKQAQTLFERAQRIAKDAKNEETKGQAKALLDQVEEMYPGLRGVRDLRIALEKAHPVLRVGVRELPQYLSPGRATTDVELQAVELLFEGLVKLSPDGDGTSRYRPGMSEGRPRVIPLGRRFYLPRNAYWTNGEMVTSADVRSSVRLLQDETKGPVTGRSPAYGTLLQDVGVNEASRADVHLNQGFIDPLALMTFKVLPPGVRTDTKEFAKDPIGSGPYRCSLTVASGGYVSFLANPGYTSRSNTAGLPRIREIRFYKTPDPLRDFKAGRLDLALNLTAEQYAQLRHQAMANNVTVPLPTSTSPPNRRIYFLAVNHRKAPLDDATLRQAIAHAIHREKLLDDYFRGGAEKAVVHKPINGPYPAHAWACKPGLKGKGARDSLDLYDPDLVAGKLSGLKEAQKAKLKDVKLELKYPKDDADVKLAMEGDPEKGKIGLCEQLSKAVGIGVTPVAVDAWQLRQDVEETFSYDLAYYSYDFPDDTYWLWALFGPQGRSGKENFLGYTGDETLLRKVTDHRDFARVQELARAIHEKLYAEMPLIPLWQLDPFHAFHSAVKAPAFDPNLVFTDIEVWKLER